jgi:hypothetical protein
VASKSLKKVLLFISFFYIFINGKTLVANEWLIGDVGVFQGLDKITARIKTFKIKVGVSKTFGILDINLQKCVYSKPLDEPESIAYIKVLDKSEKYSVNKDKLSIFEGWIFASSPALNAMEHPVYDVSLISCKKDKTLSNKSSSLMLKD